MNKELILDMYYAAPELWYALGLLFFILLITVINYFFQILKLKQKNYFINRDRERYAETLYASKDGYFAFIYPDQKVNDPRQMIRERCSRRLAVMLSLQNGVSSSFDEVLKNFYKDDVKKLQKYMDLLREEGASFSEEFVLKSNKYVRIEGSKINGVDGDIYCDMLWFRDISHEISSVLKLEELKKEYGIRLLQNEYLMDNIPCPIWMRDENLKLINVNQKYLEFIGHTSKKEAVYKGLEIINNNGVSISKNLAFLAKETNLAKSEVVGLTLKGERRCFNVVETPFYAENDLDKIYTVGTLIDITELDELKRNLKHHQDAHVGVLGALDTAFAVFDNRLKLSFYNKSFALIWHQDEAFLDKKPTYSMFLDAIRQERILPEVTDFKSYKEGEQKDFATINVAKEDMLHLPNGKTLRRIRAPHPDGGLIFAFEDVSEKLELKRAYNTVVAVNKEILASILDPVLIFSAQGSLKFYNKHYIKMWPVKESILKKEPDMSELFEYHREFFEDMDDWDNFKVELINYIRSLMTKSFVIKRKDGEKIEVFPVTLLDESIMIIYKKK